MQVEEQQKQSVGGMAGANNVQLEFNLNQRAVREKMLHSDARSCWLCQGGAVGTKTNLRKLDSVGWRRGASYVRRSIAAHIYFVAETSLQFSWVVFV
jgi:hypothetical protein